MSKVYRYCPAKWTKLKVVSFKRSLLKVEAYRFSANLARLFCLGCPIANPTQHNFFFTEHYINSFFLNAQQAGQAVTLGRLSLRMYLWSCQLFLENVPYLT